MDANKLLCDRAPVPDAWSVRSEAVISPDVVAVATTAPVPIVPKGYCTVAAVAYPKTSVTS